MPELLWEAAKEYFEWCDANPWYKTEQLKKPFTYKDENGAIKTQTITHIPTARPYTIKGLCVFLQVDDELLDNYGEKKDFSEVVTRIRTIIYTQKFEGAAVGAFNPAIMIRELGLVDKHSLKGEMINHNSEPLRIDQMKDISKALDNDC